MVLRDQNEVVKNTVDRRQKSDCAAKSKSPGIPFAPLEDEESNAVCFFVTSWVLFPRDPQTDRGISELLPLFFGNLRPGTPLSLSLNATSRFLFETWERPAEKLETAQMQVAYGKAISATRLALQDPSECCSDETVMAVLLLGLYEVREIPQLGLVKFLVN